jgi:hypothetical protein
MRVMVVVMAPVHHESEDYSGPWQQVKIEIAIFEIGFADKNEGHPVRFLCHALQSGATAMAACRLPNAKIPLNTKVREKHGQDCQNSRP